MKAKIGDGQIDSDEDQIDRGDDHHLNASMDDDEDDNIMVELHEEGTRNNVNKTWLSPIKYLLLKW